MGAFDVRPRTQPDPTRGPNPGLLLSELQTKTVIDDMFGFSRTLGADYRGQWLSNTTFEIEIVTIGQANVDATSTSAQ